MAGLFSRLFSKPQVKEEPAARRAPRRKQTPEEIHENIRRMASAARERQIKLGITHYIWRTVQDEVVCPQCEALDGKKFSWKQKTGHGFPGECRCIGGGHLHCRCSADPVFDLD